MLNRKAGDEVYTSPASCLAVVFTFMGRTSALPTILRHGKDRNLIEKEKIFRRKILEKMFYNIKRGDASPLKCLNLNFHFIKRNVLKEIKTGRTLRPEYIN